MNPASDNGWTSRCRSFENSDCGPAFESQCSRRGCTHVFTYAGTNPFGELAVMVTAHRRYCAGRDVRCVPETLVAICADDVTPLASTPRRCTKAAWQPPASLVQQFQARSSVQAAHRDKGRDDGDVAVDGVTSGVRAAGPVVEALWSHPSPLAGDRRQCGQRRMAIPVYPWHKAKKTARKEAERKALLEANPWVYSVSATEVVCEGCRQRIKLDARFRYYPGLWEKHRDRCDGVRVKRACRRADHPNKPPPRPTQEDIDAQAEIDYQNDMANAEEDENLDHGAIEDYDSAESHNYNYICPCTSGRPLLRAQFFLSIVHIRVAWHLSRTGTVRTLHECGECVALYDQFLAEKWLDLCNKEDNRELDPAEAARIPSLRCDRLSAEQHGVLQVARRFFGLRAGIVGAAPDDVGVEEFEGLEAVIPDNVAIATDACLWRYGLQRSSSLQHPIQQLRRRTDCVSSRAPLHTAPVKRLLPQPPLSRPIPRLQCIQLACPIPATRASSQLSPPASCKIRHPAAHRRRSSHPLPTVRHPRTHCAARHMRLPGLHHGRRCADIVSHHLCVPCLSVAQRTECEYQWERSTRKVHKNGRFHSGAWPLAFASTDAMDAALTEYDVREDPPESEDDE
ncbi:hypothetical protein GGX14DRAFT_637234 [Mycena pura]|uniref:Uncharacterized protein n=1 Tax=Mycena pura TaxID=153505 RepID=A0AAD6V9S0_9AGAR|nr:hypothetical protein GGX14DRAFT_637234 [Mycena pura]